MPAESKLRAYIKKTREIIASDDFTLGLTEDQKRQVIDGFKKRIAELSAAESDAFKQEAENILATDEYEKAQQARDNTRGASDGVTVLNALVRGGVSLPTNAATLTAQAADMLGLRNTAMLLDQYAKDTDYDTEQMFPRAAEDSGYPIRILEAAGENAPTMLATGLGTKALLSGVGRLGVTSNRAAKTLEVLGTAAGMSVPELRKDSVQTNLYGGVIPLENPSAVLAGAIPHALIETGMGVTPLGLVGGADKAGLFKKGFSELLARYQRRYGNRAASRLLLDRLMTETPLGEGAEEVLQNPVGAFTRNLANNNFSTAIQKTGDEITKQGYFGQLGEEFIIGTGVGAVYSGAKALIDKKIEDPKTPVTEKQQLAMTKERLQIENQARLQLPYTGDASIVLPDGSPITDVPGMAARDPRSRNIVSILPDGTPVYDDVDPRLTSPARVSPTALPQPVAPGLLPPPPSAVELGNMFLRAHARGDQASSLALRDYAESRSNTAPRARVEPLKGGEYDRMTVRVDGVQIPTENRTLLRGNPDAAARLEKKLPQQSNVTLPVESNIAAPAKSADEMTDDEWLAATRFYRSGKTKNAQLPNGKRVILTSEATEKTFRENSRDFLLSVRPKTKPATSNDTFLKIQADQANIKPPGNDEVVTKNGYKVESYQGGFRVLDSEGKQYSWHTNRQAADDKAAELTSGKTAPVIAPKAEVKTETKPVETQPSTRITAENAEMLANAQRLRKSAASLLEQAQGDLNRDRQTNTARRARMAAGATDDALNREAFAKTMNNLADAMERGEVRYLKGVKSRPDLMLFKNELTLALGRHARKNDKPYDWYKKEPVTDAAIRDGAEFNRPHPYGDWFDHAARELEAIQGMKPAAAYIEKLGRGNRSRNVSLSDEAIGKILDIKKTIAKKGIKTPYQFARILETVEDYQKLKAAGIKSDSDLADALIEYRNLEAGKKQESPLVKAERELIGKKFEGFDFFPTPPALAERMAQELDIKPGMKVLEPSAGKGDLADAVKAAQPEADVKVIEPLSDLREILTMKNHEVIDANFENFETDQKFDRIIMNPPFSKNRDIRHVRKAYELLAPGGKMVAIMGNHFTFANDKESVEFRDWLDTVGGTSENLGQAFAGKDAFRQTGVNSQLVTIEKPTGAGAKTTLNRKHSYSNTDVAVPKTVADKMLDLGKTIPTREIYIDKDDPSYGRETRPHITVRYGLSTDNPADLRRLSDLPPITVEMGEVSIFETDKYDVVKVDIESEGLRAANKKVGELVEVPGETYKDYKPHATIAYVKKGEGKKYIGNKSLLGQTFEIDEINLVDRNGKEHPIKLTGKPDKTRVRTEPGKAEVSGQTLETPSTASDLVRTKDPIQTIRDVYNSNSDFRRGRLNSAFIGRVTRALAPMGVDKWKIDLAVTNIKQRNARASTGVMTWINDDDLIAELLKAGDIKRPAAAVVQTEDRAGVDLVKPEEKDFASATDYLKALTKWREKTGNLTAAEVKRRDRALRFADRAAKTGQKASGLFRQADKISERFYMGQPILVGHHSERGARAAQNRMHNKMDAALKEEKKAEYYSQRAESAEKNKSISSADEDAIVKLKAKLESISSQQEQMKRANKVAKATKLSGEEKITKLQEQGFSEAEARKILEADYGGRVGFPAYVLQSNNAEMSRLKKRIEELSVKQSQQTQKIEFDGGEIVDNVAENRLQIFFDSKPDEATREKLKSNGFRWAPSAGAWQMHRSAWANRKAESITGAKIPAAQPAQAAPVEDQSYTDQAEMGEPVKAEPVRQLYKNDDIIFRFPDGRETGAYIIDPELKTIDGAPGQVYVKMDNGAVRFIPQDWITKSKHSPMVQNRLDAEKTEASRAAKPAVPVSKNVKVADDGRKVITVFTDYKKAYAAMEKEAGILLTPSQNAEASWWTVYYKSKRIGNLQRSSHESGFLFTYDHDMLQAETEDFAAKRKKTAEELIAEVKSVTRKYLDEDPRFKTRTEIASRDIRAGAGVTALRSAPMPGNAFGKIPGGKNKGFYIGKDGYVLEDATVAIDGRPEIETGYEQRPDVPAINVLIDKYGFDKNATGLIAVPNYSRKGAFGDAFKLFATDGKDAQTIIAGEEISASVQITENPVTGEEVYFNYELLRAAQIELGELSLAQIGKDELNRRAGMFKNKDGRIAIIAEFDAKAGGNDLISQITKASGLGRRGAVLNPAVFAKYAASRIAAKFSAGFEILRSGAAQFAKWARQMVNDFGKAIRKHLRTLWTDLTAVLQSRRGMIRIAGWKSPQMIENIQRVSDTANARRRTMREISSVYTDMDFRQNRNRMGSAAQPMSDRWIAQLEAAGANPFIDNNGADQRRRANARFREQQARAYAEIAAREIVEPGSPAAKEATEAFFKEWAERFGGRRGAALNLGGDAMTIFLNGATKFADWARALVKKYGKSVTSLLKNLWTDLDNFNKRLGKTGAISGRPGGLKNSGSGHSSPAPDKTAGGSPAESKQMVTSRGLVWKRIDKDTYELELTDPNTGKTSVVETIRRPKGTDNIWNVDNWTTFDNKGTGSGSFTSLKVAKAAIKAHARDAFNQRIYRENSVVKDRQRDEALKKKRERGLEQDKERDAREAAQHKKRKEKSEEFIAKGKKKKAREPEKPKTWRDQARSFVAKAEEVLFDAWAPVRRLQETIKKAAGVSELPESLDLYQKLEVVAGKVEAGTRIFKDKYFKQIKDYLVENNINYNEANRFLAIMHAEERNDAIAERNPAFALTGAPGSGIETETARKEIAEHKKNGTYEKLLKFAEMTYRLNNALLDEQVRYGLLSQKQRDAYRRYKNYTPMKSPPDQGFVLDRTAFGRRSEATDQLAYIEKAIDVVYKRGERKQVINTALNLFSKYSNPKLYREYEPDQVQYYDKRTGKVRLRTDTSKLYNNPAVIWSRDVNSGELKAFEIKDPGLQNALNRQYSDTGVEQKAFRYFARVNRWLAGVSTAYNPEFIFTNLLRDVQQGAASVGVNLPEGSVKKFVENLGRAKKAISDARAGKVTVDTGLLEEFQLAGGKTGYSELSRLEDTAKDLEREISEAQTGGRWYDTKQSLVKVRDWIADWNDAIETRTRFAGYLTAKEAGFSTQKSAAFAKGMTINFNKKGTWAPVFNSLYLFSSASLGGSFVTANIIGKAAKTPKGRAMIAGAIGLGFVMELLNRAVAGDDDDEGVNYYDKVPDYIKDSNYVFMVPGTKGKYFAIPMPYGLNVLPSIGRNMAASMFGVQSFKAGAANVVGAVLNSFNPIGGDNRGFGYQLVPTAARPFIDIATNSSWTGRKIRPDQPAFGAKLARSELYFDQESKVLTAATRALNELTGGDRFTGGFVSLSPADVSHLLESFTGGVGRTLSRSADTVTRVVTGESPELDNVPVVRRFGGEATDYNTWQTFKENSEIVEDFERARRERNIEYLRANRQLLPAVALYKNIGKRITSVRKKPSLSEPEKQKLILSMQKSFNKKFREIRDKALSKN